jgi:hypothetical protein
VFAAAAAKFSLPESIVYLLFASRLYNKYFSPQDKSIFPRLAWVLGIDWYRSDTRAIFVEPAGSEFANFGIPNFVGAQRTGVYMHGVLRPLEGP